jgi:hypothetical protein
MSRSDNTNPIIVADAASTLLNNPPSRRNVVQRVPARITMLADISAGRYVAACCATAAPLTPANAMAVGTTQQGRVRNPATAPMRLPNRILVTTSFAASSGDAAYLGGRSTLKVLAPHLR